MAESTQMANEDFVTEVAELLVNDVASAETPSEGGQDAPGAADTSSEGDSSSEAAEAVTEDLTPEVPAELLAELEDAEEPEEDEDEIALDVEPDSQWEDEETRKLKAKIRKLEKREAFLEKQRVKDGQKLWAEDARKYFPLAKESLDSIKATSRRDYLRQAKEIHDRFAPVYDSLKEAHKKALEQDRERIRQEIRSEMEEAWGTPSVIPDTGQQDMGDNDRRMQFRTSKRQSLADQISARIRSRG